MTPISKQSKKVRKRYDASRRGGWNGLAPVTRIVPNKKVYDRKRIKREDCKMRENA